MNHFITAIAFYDGQLGRTRTFGYFHKKSKAEEAVKGNRGDMVEALYNYLVIEAMEEGIHPISSNEMWYKWVRDKHTREGEWQPCEKPKFSQQTINWAIG